MYLYSKPHVHQSSQQGTHTDGGGAMKTPETDQTLHLSPSNPRSSPSHPLSPPSAPHTFLPPPPPPPPPPRPSKDRRNSLPFTFPPLYFGGNTSSASLVSSTAEAAKGKPIPLDVSTAAHRTSALRELNSNYPSPVSRHRYAKSTGAKSSTYSQPVIVRTYSGPSPSQHPHAHSQPHSHAGHRRLPSAGRPGPRRIPLPAPPPVAALFTPTPQPLPTKPSGVRVSNLGNHANGGLLSMARAKAKKKLPWPWGAREEEEPKLPPVEDFSIKSIMAKMPENNVNADLDRIAEICARTRYSLSNQYEVHVAPHGSGAGFMSGVHTSSSRKKGSGHRREAGPTLQAVQSDDDENTRTHRKRRSAGRRRSIAYGTLETIMSSSRSSEEDKSKKKSASEIAEEVRGRASRKGADGDAGAGSGSGSTTNGVAGDHSHAGEGAGEDSKKPNRKKSISFAHAVIDSSRQAAGSDSASPRNSAAALVSQPALPKTSSSHLEIRTTAEPPFQESYGLDIAADSPSGAGAESPLSFELPHVGNPRDSNAGLLSNISGWIPWRAGAAESSQSQGRKAPPSHAEGSLRDLLKTADANPDKGKGVASTA